MQVLSAAELRRARCWNASLRDPKSAEHAAEKRIRSAALLLRSFFLRTIIYKGLLTAHQIEAFYPDLADESGKRPGLVHQRYSTNTRPSWPLPSPSAFRPHGEINSLRGNIIKMRAREHSLASEHFGDALAAIGR